MRPSAPVRQSFVASSRAEADHRQRRRPAGSRHCVLWEEEEEKEIQYHFVFLGLLRGGELGDENVLLVKRKPHKGLTPFVGTQKSNNAGAAGQVLLGKN